MDGSDRPNVLLILTDQQSASMLSCAGNEHVRTPAMDGIAAGGVRFERAYCSNPVCVPSKFSIFTGRMPGEIGLRDNDVNEIADPPEQLLKSTPGWLLREAGYEVAYGGVQHLPRMTAEDLGFEVISRDQRDELPAHCAGFLGRNRDRPFFLVASFINPHDICYMAIRDFAGGEEARRLLQRGELPLSVLDEALELPGDLEPEEFFAKRCPPLPANFEPQQDEPEAVRRMQAERPFKRSARADWPEERWRLHRWAYARLTERVDAQIGRLLAALGESRHARNTVVILTSDHGDMDSAHRMEHKTALYEQACRVPLLISAPGAVSAGGAVSDLVSNGLDLAPTICDCAGVAVPEGLAGRSLRPFLEGRVPEPRREWLAVEGDRGSMIVTERYKYVLYDRGAGREQLLDLEADPGEMRNAAADPECAEVLERCRGLFAKAFPDRPLPAREE